MGKKKDGAIDRLLRAYVSRPVNRTCSEFDADLANAYIERSLTPASRSNYEQHLSECVSCRKNVVAVQRMVAASIPAHAVSRNIFSGSRQALGASSWPRWAMAAAAVIVVALSVPLLLTRKGAGVDQQTYRGAAEQQPSEDARSAGPSLENGPSPASRTSATGSSSSAAPTAKQSEKRETEVATNAPAGQQQPAGAGGDRASSDGKTEAKPESTATDKVQSKSDSQPVTVAASGQPVQERERDKGDTDSAGQRKDAQASDSKSNRTDEDQQSAKEKAKVAETAPPPPSAPQLAGGRGLRRPAAKLALRDSSTTEAVRAPERRIVGKRFLFRDDTWTDKDFNADKDLPVVTIIRDSNVYKEVLAKRAGLKPYLTGFAETERAIIVYKGTVYKLIPQQSEK